MMRWLIRVAALILCVSAAGQSSKPVTRVQLPCESRYQTLSPTGTQVAVHCKDGSLRLVDVTEGEEQRVFPGAQRPNGFAYSSDGSYFAIGFEDGGVEVAPSRGSAPSTRWKADSRRIDTLYFFPEAKAIVVGAVDSPAQVWEVNGDPTLRATLPFEFGGLIACVVSPDGKLLVTAGDDTVIRWYDTATWHKRREYRGFLLETFALAFTPDGKHVLAGGADSRITVLDAATAKEVRQLPAEAGSYIVDIEVMGDKQRAATAYLDGAGVKPATRTRLGPDQRESRGRQVRFAAHLRRHRRGQALGMQRSRKDADVVAIRVARRTDRSVFVKASDVAEIVSTFLSLPVDQSIECR